jgi:opacity protein-like surface antigen
MFRRILYFLVVVNGYFPFYAQTDSLKKRLSSIIQLNIDTNVLFQHKRLESNTVISQPKLEIGAYLSTYYALYTEDDQVNFVKHPTMAARNNQFGLNMAMISLAYKSTKLRSNITFHYGDVAESTWPTKYNLIQEANAGVQLIKKLWLDVGVFRSHIGLESTQPRENITSSMSLANVYEPYYFSGAKLTYNLNTKLSLQLNAFNSFASIIETNKNKLIGTSIVYNPNESLTFTYNFITGDDSPDGAKIKHQRYYHNLYFTYQKNKWSLGAEFNFGIQEYSKIIDTYTLSTAYMNSSLVVVKHQTFELVGFYGRGEWFSDINEIISAGTKMGKYTWGSTLGIEYKPLKNVAISIEGRYLKSEKPNFIYNNSLKDNRIEGIFCFDVWF